MNPVEDRVIERASTADLPAVLELWLASVRATHGFLAPGDVEAMTPQVRDEVLPALEIWVVRHASGSLLGWMGLDDAMLEALFVAPAAARQGVGRALLRKARALKGPLRVDVNEQNPEALGFYLANGFEVTGRSPLDGQGRPFPLLHLAERAAASNV